MGIEQVYLDGVVRSFETYKGLADKALVQVSDEQFFAALDAESNSLAVIVKHLAGNLRSRWTDFLTTDGEKPDRNRDAEFEVGDSASRAELMDAWAEGWDRAFSTLKALTADDLSRTVHIRGEPLPVVIAINRQLTHGAYHIGQIVFLAKHFAGESWQVLTIPRAKARANARAASSESRT